MMARTPITKIVLSRPCKLSTKGSCLSEQIVCVVKKVHSDRVLKGERRRIGGGHVVPRVWEKNQRP
jgi:hypothetical protein